MPRPIPSLPLRPRLARQPRASSRAATPDAELAELPAATAALRIRTGRPRSTLAASSRPPLASPCHAATRQVHPLPAQLGRCEIRSNAWQEKGRLSDVHPHGLISPFC